jgi:anaerobic magnesium-protoporphyrin IX monomethyl ester cyclase
VSRGRVLFLYPNSEGYGGIPNGIALLSACLKQADFETACFDTTFIKSPPIDHLQRQKYGTVKKSDASRVWKHTRLTDKKIEEMLTNQVELFKPDLVAVSLAEVNFLYGISLLKALKQHHDIPVIAGGIFPTLCPELVIKEDYADAVCIGEGEDAIIEFADCVVEGKPWCVENLWVKFKDGSIGKNMIRKLKNLDELPFQDWSIFDERHIYKPYCGGFYRTGFFEFGRGCQFNCSYCCTSALRQLYKGLGSFIRFKSIDKALDEVCYMKQKYGLELIFVTDDDFLFMTSDRFNYFCEQYKKRVCLPFFIQTRSETVTEEKIKKLKEITPNPEISTIAIGIEHGSEEYRRKYMNRLMKNADLERAFSIIHKHGLRSTANVIMACPHETHQDFLETIKLLRRIHPKSVSVSYLQPFHGTRMRQMCVEAGYIEPDHIIADTTKCLKMHQFPEEKIRHYYENFSKYVSGELELPH